MKGKATGMQFDKGIRFFDSLFYMQLYLNYVLYKLCLLIYVAHHPEEQLARWAVNKSNE